MKKAILICSIALLCKHLQAQTNLDKASFHYNKGVELLGQQDFDKAIQYFQASLTARPDFGPAVFAIGLSHLGKKEFDAACAYFERAKQLGNKSALEYHQTYCGEKLPKRKP